MSSSEEIVQEDTSSTANMLRSPSASRFQVDKVDNKKVPLENQLTISTTVDTLVRRLITSHISALYICL